MFTLTLKVDDTVSITLRGGNLVVLMERAASEYPTATIVAAYGQVPGTDYDEIPF